MKKFLISLGLCLVLAFYVIYERGAFSSNHAIINTQSLSNPDTSQVQPPPQPTPIPTPTPTPKKKLGQYKDGQYTGSVADAFYGPLQVKATISNGKIVDVKFLQYPNDRPTSIQVNTAAIPYLKQEALQVQNANVDIVTGATQSSEAFRESLAVALTQAKN